MLSDESSVVTDRYAYTAFGEIVEHEGDEPNPYRYAGEPVDPDSGLYFNRARWLDPSTGRFLSVDPFPADPTNPLSLNRYAYVDQDPVNRVDPSGLSSNAELSVAFAVVATTAAVGLDVTFEALRHTQLGNDPALRELMAIWDTASLTSSLVSVSQLFATAGAVGGRLATRIFVFGRFGLSRSPRGKIVLDLFGGEVSQIPGAINVDLIARQGVRGTATSLPFRSGAIDEIVISNPFIPGGGGSMDFLPEAARVLRPGGKIFLNATERNRFGRLPDLSALHALGLKVSQEAGPLHPRFSRMEFRFTDRSKTIPTESVKTTLLEKVR